MPSASVKVEKQAPPETALPESMGTLTPLRQAITIIEHKIRNLEKRKSKLESYRELQNSGKDLNADQKTAVAKYGEVAQTLEFARDLSKQFMGIVIVTEKDAKRLAKKEAAARSASELAKVREVLLVQDALNQMGQYTVRKDFLRGSNGAATLVQSDLDILDELYPAVTPKHEAGDRSAFTAHVQSAAEHLIAVVDGKQKDAFLGSTYSQIKEVIGKVHESGYLDTAIAIGGSATVDDTDGAVAQEQAVEPATGVEAVNDELHQHESEMVLDCPEQEDAVVEGPNDMHQQQRSGGGAPAHQQQAANMVGGEHSAAAYHHAAGTPAAVATTAPSVPVPHIQSIVAQPVPVLVREMNSPPAALPHHLLHHQQQIPAVQQQQQQQNILPPMQQQSVIESQQIMQQQLQQQPQGPPPSNQPLYYQQPLPPRNINEVLGPGSFFFLQESEIDNPVMTGSGDQLSSINSQTFTNQTYTPSPQLQPSAQISQQTTQQMPMQQSLPPQQQQQQQVIPPSQAVTNNMQTIYTAHQQHQQPQQQQALHPQQHHQQSQVILHTGIQRSSVSPVHTNVTKHAYNNSNNTNNNGAMDNGAANSMSTADENNVLMDKHHRNVAPPVVGGSGGNSGSGGHRGPSRTNSNHHHHQSHNQPFYANNGYSNRNNRSSGSSGPSRSSRPQHNQ